MGKSDFGKLGHTPKEKTSDEIKAEKERYKKAGYNPGTAQLVGAIDVVGGELTDKKVKQVQCGCQHTVVVTEDGDVYAWGRGRSGALGHGDRENVSLPKKVEALKDIVKIDCGQEYTMALDKNGKLYAFGENRYGQLGVKVE